MEYVLSLGNHKLGVGGLINYGLLRISKDEEFDVTDEGSRGWVDWRAREILLCFKYFIAL